KDGAGPAGIDAELRVHCIERDTRAVCFENMVLHVRGNTAHHLDSVVEPFTLPDVPVVVWLPHRLLTIDDPLLVAADRLVVDSRAAGREGRFTVERTGDQELRAAAEVAGEARIERVADLGDRSTASMLGRALTAIGRDEVYEQALASALDFRR